MQFKTEVTELLQLMIHSLYSNPEIFLRELISNASDACDKRSLMRAAGADDGAEALEISLFCDEAAKLLIIEDSGCGMSAAELEENLGTIAHSGTKAFMKAESACSRERLRAADASSALDDPHGLSTHLGGDCDAKSSHDSGADSGAGSSGAGDKSADLIGQFGVGFYSAFMVAGRIEVFSRAVGSEQAHCWSSDATGYDITPATKDAPGTRIILHLKDSEFASEHRVRYLVQKYSKHINYPIRLEVTERDAEGKEAGKKLEQINAAGALWKQQKTALKDDDYVGFYKDLSYGEEPLMWQHFASEGALEFSALMYVPKTAPRDLFMADYERGMKLYVRRVLISEKEDLLPVWLRFARGVIDVADLELNVSREILQNSDKIAKISKICAKKLLAAMNAATPEQKSAINEQFGAVLKEGLLDPAAPHEEIYKLLTFSSSAGKISLAEYIEKYADAEKKEIYYLQGENEALMAQNALVAGFGCVIYLSDRVDEFLHSMLPEFRGYKWANIAEAKISYGCEGEQQEALAAAVAQALGGSVSAVKFSDQLGEKLAAIVYDAEDQNYQMQKMMARFAPGEAGAAAGILLLNSAHSLVAAALAGRLDDAARAHFAQLAYGQAALSAAQKVEDVQKLSDAAIYFANRAVGADAAEDAADAAGQGGADGDGSGE